MYILGALLEDNKSLNNAIQIAQQSFDPSRWLAALWSNFSISKYFSSKKMRLQGTKKELRGYVKVDRGREKREKEV